MKLRRALATAVAAAAIAPATLMAAPAAFAADASASAAPSVSASAAPAPAATTSTSVAPSTSASAKSTTTTASASASATSDPWSTATDCAVPGQDGSASDSSLPSDPGSVLQLTISGLPSKIVAGSGWHQFTMHAANPTDQALGSVKWMTVVDNFSNSNNEKDWLSTYAHLEYFDGTSWQSIEKMVGTGMTFGETTLGAQQTIDIKLRVSIDAKAPVGAGAAFGFGGYIDSAKNCVHSTYAEYDFTVAAPGSTGTVPPAQPKPKPKPPTKVTTQEGGATLLPPTGSLAHTGASDATPMIAGIGAAAVLLGAGAMFAVRRRKGSAQA